MLAKRSADRADNMASLTRMSTMDIANQLNTMLEAESQLQYQCNDYLRGAAEPHQCSSRRSQRKAVTPTSRGKIVQWLYDCVDYLELQRECVAIAMSYVDRFMSTASPINGKSLPKALHKKVAESKSDATVYQLLALSALFLAAKQSSKVSPVNNARVLVRVSHGSYSVQEIIEMESTLLSVLDWRLCGPTASSISYHLIALLSKSIDRKNKYNYKSSNKSDARIASVVDFTRLQIELAVSDYSTSVLRSPSAIALASILNSMELLDFTSHERTMFGRSLMASTKNLTLYSNDVEKARVELHDVFDRQSTTVMKRANGNNSNGCTTKAATSSSDDNMHDSFHTTLTSQSPNSVEDTLLSSSSFSHEAVEDGTTSRRHSSTSRNSRRQSTSNSNGKKNHRVSSRRRAQPSPTTCLLGEKLEP